MFGFVPEFGWCIQAGFYFSSISGSQSNQVDSQEGKFSGTLPRRVSSHAQDIHPHAK